MIISNAALRNRVVVGVLVLLISLAGLYSYLTLPRESAPDVPIPLVVVSTMYNGVAPADVESSVTQKIESKLTGIKGVKEVRSTSAEGMSNVIVEFQPDIRIEDALQYVRDKVDQAKGDLPNSTDLTAPIVREINIAEFPILYLSISGPISPVTLKDIGDKLKDAIEQNVPGVLQVAVLGGLEREIRLEIDPDRVAFYNLTIPEIMTLIPSEHVNISAGGLETQGTKFNVRIPAEFKEAKDINHIPLANRNGRQVFLSDVAVVRDSFKDRQTISRLNGEGSITIAVQKRVGANILELVDGVKKVVDAGKGRVPQAVKFTYTMDRSKDIKMMVADLENNIGAALVLVLIVMLISIGLRASMVVALAVPLSMLMSFAILSLMGHTLNMVVLFSLVLSVGMLVDDAIVIVENIYRHMHMGKGRMRAAREATAEVAWPVITSTLTTCAAFFPMLFWPGVFGSFFKYLPITLITTLLSSLFVAMVVSPVVCTLVPGKSHEGNRDNVILRGYRRFLTLAVSHRVTTMLLCCLLLVGMVVLYAKRGHGVEFFPDIDPKNAIINLRCPQGTNIAQTDALMREVERRVMPRLANGEIAQIVANIGADSGGMNMMFGGSAGGPQEGALSLVFPDYENRHKPSAKVIAEIRAELTDLAGVEVKVEKQANGPPAGAAVTVRLIGSSSGDKTDDLKKLAKINTQARTLIQNVPGLVNLRSDLELTRPELVFHPDRERAKAAGVDAATIGNFLKSAIFGSKVGTYRVGNDEYDITIRMPESQRVSIQDMLRLRVPNQKGSAVPLASVGTFDYSGGLGTINRVNQKRVITLTGDAEGRLGTDTLRDVQEILSKYGRNRVLVEDVVNWQGLLSALSSDTALARQIRDRLSKADSKLISADADKLTTEQKGQLIKAISDVLTARDLKDHLPGLSDEDMPLLSAQPPALWWGPFYLLQIMIHPEVMEQEKLYNEQVLRRNRAGLEILVGNAIKPAVKVNLPDGYEIKYAGQDEEMQKAMSFLLKAFVVALILIVLIMVAQFNTLSVPFVIMTTVALSLIGVLIGLVSTGTPFGVIMTGIGVISLAGVVVKNGIVLMDYTRQLQKKGLSVMEACIEAGTIRLRPVLLTAACTVLGLVPVALGWTFDFHTMHWAQSEASEWWVGMAVAVIFGLTFATVLTLVVVPCLYVMLFGVASKLGLGGLKGLEDEEQEAQMSEAVQ